MTETLPSPSEHDVPHGFRRDLVRWQQLVRPAWLAALTTDQPVDAAPRGDWCLLEVGNDNEAAFRSTHIPGAAWLDTRALEEPPFWNKVADPALLARLLRLGIRHDTTVVLYGRDPLPAARAAQLLLYAGVTDVRLLDGGLAAWRVAGLPLEAGAARRRPAASDFGAAFPGRPDYLIGTAQASALLQRPDGALVSIRTFGEFTGKTSGYSFIAARGDIRGARWGRAGDDGDVNSMSEYLHADGTFKAADTVRAFWQAADIHAGQQVAFYCGTGWRASLAFFQAWLMGWERIAVYDGGWFEWSDPGNPVA